MLESQAESFSPMRIRHWLRSQAGVGFMPLQEAGSVHIPGLSLAEQSLASPQQTLLLQCPLSHTVSLLQGSPSSCTSSSAAGPASTAASRAVVMDDVLVLGRTIGSSVHATHTANASAARQTNPTARPPRAL